jgi:hypothetical protein
MWKKTVDKYGQKNSDDEAMTRKKFFRLTSGKILPVMAKAFSRARFHFWSSFEVRLTGL